MKTIKMKKQKTKTVRTAFFKCCILIGILILFTKCSKAGLPSVKCATGSWVDEWSTAQEALSAASQAYGNDSSTENCTNYKNAINNYLDAYDKFSNCLPAASRADLEESIKESRAEAAEIDCSGD